MRQDMLSVIILTHNNEKTLPQLLHSLSWCDERIVVDDCSQDHTPILARKDNAAVYARPLEDDFAGQRNFGLTKAKGDWILFVDSDEEVTDALRDEIKETVMRKNDDRIQGYYIKRDDLFFGKILRYGETSDVRLLRLARKNSGIWKRPVHEYWDVSGETGVLSSHLIHRSHDSIRQFLADIDRYSMINAKHFFKEHVRALALSIFLYPVAKFFQNYIVRLGFLDGTEGCIMAIMMSMHSFLTRSKLYMLNRDKEIGR